MLKGIIGINDYLNYFAKWTYSIILDIINTACILTKPNKQLLNQYQIPSHAIVQMKAKNKTNSSAHPCLSGIYPY